MIPNYGEMRRYGEPVSTAFVESTINEVIARRMAKAADAVAKRLIICYRPGPTARFEWQRTARMFVSQSGFQSDGKDQHGSIAHAAPIFLCSRSYGSWTASVVIFVISLIQCTT